MVISSASCGRMGLPASFREADNALSAYTQPKKSAAATALLNDLDHRYQNAGRDELQRFQTETQLINGSKSPKNRRLLSEHHQYRTRGSTQRDAETREGSFLQDPGLIALNFSP